MKLTCPACGADVSFKSKASVFGVCSYCNSTLVRHDLQIESLGKMSELPEDMSPLQIGTTGKFEGSQFEILGRQYIVWADGFWNEWFIHFDNGKDGWLADAQGFYMVSFQEMKIPPIPKVGSLAVGDQISLRETKYIVEDIRSVSCTGSQGELPVKSVAGRKSISVDLMGPGQSCANIDYSDDGNRLFFGNYAEFESFEFKKLRVINGW